MVIASIDVQGGKVVQLKQGSELVLQRDNPEELAAEFDRYGEVAVIDLDAAMGKGSNADLIKPLFRKAQCRVGGGIRTPEQARELVSLGAQKIILGSSVFRNPAKKGAGMSGGEFTVNIPFLEALVKAIGRERVIVAVDASGIKDSQSDGTGNYEIVVDGWKTPTGLDLIESAKAVEPYASELLFTCVDREGTMTGIDLGPVEKLRGAVSCGITAAGGVSTLEEIESLAARNCDVQLGMALYTGKIKLADAFIASLNWKKAASSENAAALLPVIAQSPDGQVLMTGFTNREALSETFKRGSLCFHSRTRNKLWMKGESSGNTLKLLRLRADCDRDAILAVVEPRGPVCHTGAWTCFETGRRYTWEYLQAIIAERFRSPAPGSYTATLDDELVREKVMEEAEEVCTAKTHDEIVWEAADLLYFTTALITRAGVDVGEVLDELDRRHKK
ncbi:phosphoribosyl-ATP diphosphatase [Treponema primitia]|uniref:phosphoribosyl-ATP diphosphatase n=1 Tax=Treponema primitia TaxID=88058 RepID=UPI0002554CD8|nr:phosphoribosyl-ATP diphosphatase [Treponema primitia]